MEENKSKTSLKMNLVYQMCYRILVLLTPFITSPYISRVLGADALGEYSFTLSVVNYFVMIAYLGIDNYGCRIIAETRGENNQSKLRKTFWEVYFLQAITGLVALCVYCIYCLVFIVGDKTLFLIQGLAVIGATIDINWYFAGSERFKLTVTRNTVIKLTTVCLIFLLVKEQKDLILYALIMVMGNVLSQVVMWGFLRKELTFERVSFNGIFSHMKPNIALFIPVIAVSVYHTMDKTMLGILSDYTNTGYYYNADKIISMPLGMITGLGTVFLPRMANIVSNSGMDAGRNLLKKSFELHFAIACAMSFGIAAVSNNFIPWFFGEEFIPCISLIKVFAPILIIKTLSGILQTQLLIPTNNERIYTRATFSGAFINLILNFALIPKYGAMGATIGTFGAELFVLTVESVQSIKLFNIFTQIKSNIIYCVAGIAMFIGIVVIDKVICFTYFMNLIIEVVAGGIIYISIISVYIYTNKESVFNNALNGRFRSIKKVE